MTEDKDFSLVQLDANAHNSSRAETREKLENSSSELTPWNQWLLRELSLEDFVVERQSSEDFRLPAKFDNFLPKDLISDINTLFDSAIAVNNDLVGLKISEAQVLLAGDQRAESINVAVKQWAERYVQHRSKRTAHRRGGPMQRFRHLYDEIMPDLENIIYTGKTTNRAFFSEFTDYLPWLIFQEYCAHLLEIRFDDTKFDTTFRIDSENPDEKGFLSHIVSLYQWQRRDSLAHFFAILKRRVTDIDSSLSNEQMLDRLEQLTADIREMRPFLVHNFDPQNVVIEIAPGVVISWMWALGLGEGIILVAPSEQSLRSQLSAKTNYLSLLVQYDGLLATHVLPWVGLESIKGEYRQALAINLRIVEAIHSKLLSFYAKIDVRKILERFKSRQAQAKEALPTEEEFAAICQTISEADEETGLSRPRFGAVRSQQLFSILANQLGCEVRQGKGSEIVIFRQGGHHFRLGHHKRNSYVPAVIIRHILRQVGIDMEEWLNAIA